MRGARRVLVVEDDEDCRLAITASIAGRSGLELVGAAATGAHALALAEELLPDVVVLDLGLPDVAGLELIPALRRAATSAQIVVFSATSDTTSVAAAAAGGADRYVPKAGSVVRLVDVLQEVVPTRRVALTLDEHVEEVAAGRRFVVTWARRWGWEARGEALELVASELITNAIVHAQASPTVQLVEGERSLRLEVHDRAETPPAPAAVDGLAEHGRGLQIVASLADAWGTDTTATGKVVWAEFLA